ncbi:MAG TPA: class I SAM-dependent methyltransferase [Aliidongia sp.]|nr:class I SAM-dependent methyltransferase [Aliidongia sp.]
MSALPQAAAAEDLVPALTDFVARCRFLPIPPPELHFAGDGDFRAIGAEFLGWFVGMGGMRSTDKVLEIGCGVGRMAIPLTQYLDPAQGSYDGLDPVAAGIDWCAGAISGTYPNFTFRHLDIRSDVYNPEGTLDPTTLALPCETAAYDFVYLTSVFTHLRADCVARYATEIARVLKPGGRCFATFFLMNETARRAIEAGGCRLAFAATGDGPEFLADPAYPSAAVAQTEDFILHAFGQAGLHPGGPIRYGAWSGRSSDIYQDIILFQKRAP